MSKWFGEWLPGPAGLFALLVGVSGVGAAEMRVRIPFGFTVNGRELSAGDYTVSVRDNWLMIHGRAGGACVLTDGLKGVEANQPRLVFQGSDGEYFLTQVWMGGLDGRQVVLRPEVKLLLEARGPRKGTGEARVTVPLP